MSRMQCRGWIVLAGVVVALLSSTPAKAQVVGIDPGPPRESRTKLNDVITGVYYDVKNQALAEHRLQYLEAKLRRDAELGDAAAVKRDTCQIDNLRYRIAMDEWLIRWNSREYPCFYTIRHDQFSRIAMAQATHPIQSPYPSAPAPIQGPMGGIPMMGISIVNVESAGTDVSFAIDGLPHQVDGGSRLNLSVAQDAIITYDAGGSLGGQRYMMSPGVFEFRSTPDGWVLYKLP